MKYFILKFLPIFSLLCAAAQERTCAAEFEAGIGPTIHGRCHMAYCEFSTIQVSVPVAIRSNGTLFAVSGQAWGASYDPNLPGDVYAHRPKSVDPKAPFLMMVFCSKMRPYVFWYFDGKWQANSLRPGDEDAISGADESAYQDYWASCHHFFPKDAFDPLVRKMAPKLGYHFTGGAPDGDDAVTQPSDLMR